MRDIFPLTAEDIGRMPDGRWDLNSVLPIAIKLIKEDIKSFGIKEPVINCQQLSYNYQLVIAFPSQQDLNYYKLVGHIKEEEYFKLFSDSGLLMYADVVFTISTEIYG